MMQKKEKWKSYEKNSGTSSRKNGWNRGMKKQINGILHWFDLEWLNNGVHRV